MKKLYIILQFILFCNFCFAECLPIPCHYKAQLEDDLFKSKELRTFFKTNEDAVLDAKFLLYKQLKDANVNYVITNDVILKALNKFVVKHQSSLQKIVDLKGTPFHKLLEKLPQGQAGAVFDELAKWDADAINSFITALNKTDGTLSGAHISTKIDQLDKDILEKWYILYEAKTLPRKRFDFEFLNDCKGCTTIDEFEKLHNKSIAKILDKIDSQKFPDVLSLATKRGTVRSNLLGFMNKNPDNPFVRQFLNSLESATDTQKGSRTWEEYFTYLQIEKGFNIFEIHHILPVNLLSSEALQIYFQHYKGANKISFNALGDSRNAIPLEHLSNGRGVHTQHGDYEAALRAWIESKWNGFKNRPISPEMKLNLFHKEIEKLTQALQSELIEQSVKGNKNVNDLFGVKVDKLRIEEQKPALIKAVEKTLGI